ncbi:MAG: hypothetical protein KGJ78_18100 [Alphaproteobacteria bacterium]|nr:hypothetical protein [Alphaproteobacteria bacterium]
MTRKSRLRLVITGSGILVGAILLLAAVHILLAMLTAIALGIMGFYFLTWAFKGGGWWCQDCKAYPLARR